MDWAPVFSFAKWKWSHVGLNLEEAMTSAHTIDWSGPWRNHNFCLEHMNASRWGTTSLKEWENIWSLKKRLRPNSLNIMMLKDHTKESTLTDLSETRDFRLQRSSTAISRILRQLAASWFTDNITIFATAATATNVEMDYYRHLHPVQYDIVIYSAHGINWITTIHPCHNLDSDLINQNLEWGYWLISVLHILI